MQKSDESQDKVLVEEQIDKVIESSSPNKLIMSEHEIGTKAGASNHGHEDSTNHPQFDSNPEQSRYSEVKAAIQDAENHVNDERQDEINIIQSNSNDKIKLNVKDSNCFRWFEMNISISTGRYKFKGKFGTLYGDIHGTNGRRKPRAIGLTYGKWARITHNKSLLHIVPILKSCRLTDNYKKRKRKPSNRQRPDVPLQSEEQSIDLVGKPLDFREYRRPLKVRAVELSEQKIVEGLYSE